MAIPGRKAKNGKKKTWPELQSASTFFSKLKCPLVRMEHKLCLSLTQVEHVGCRDEGHEVNSRCERQHADQDERRVADAAAKHHDTQEAGQEDGAARCVPITHLGTREKGNKVKENKTLEERKNEGINYK